MVGSANLIEGFRALGPVSRRRSDAPYEVELTSAAARQIRKLTPATMTELRQALQRLASEPRGPAVAKLTGVDAYKECPDGPDSLESLIKESCTKPPAINT